MAHKIAITIADKINNPKIIKYPVSGVSAVLSRIAPKAVLNQMSGENTNIEARPAAVPATLLGSLSSPKTENWIA